MEGMKDKQELTTNTKNTWAVRILADRPARTRGLSVRRNFLQPEPDLLKVNTTFPLPDLPNQPRDFYQIIGEGEAPLGDAMPTNL
jgi:hypothetical protein